MSYRRYVIFQAWRVVIEVLLEQQSLRDHYILVNGPSNQV